MLDKIVLLLILFVKLCIFIFMDLNSLRHYTFIFLYYMIAGGVQSDNVSAEDRSLIQSLTSAINGKIGHQHDSYEVMKVSTQVVAGTNKFFHLKGQPGNHEHTITVHIPLPHTEKNPEVAEVSCGFNVHGQGHSKHEHDESHHHHSGECKH